MTHGKGLLPRDTDESDEARLARMRAQVAGHLSGSLKAPTKVCVHCGSHALVKSVSLEVSWQHRGHSGTAVVPAAICLDGCKKTIVNRVAGMGSLTWCYGAQDVTVVDGPIFAMRDLPLNFTAKQRERGEEFLRQTAPGA